MLDLQLRRDVEMLPPLLPSPPVALPDILPESKRVLDGVE